ncbi:MAG: HAD family phosphatase [Clostridia bacterium]|nr:HAD family phosphatase [Clostridia bacterium]
MKKKTLVFDMGNVLITFDTHRILADRGLNEEEIGIFEDIVFRSPEWRAYDRGTCDKSAFLRPIGLLPPKLAALAKEMILEHVFVSAYMPPLPATEELVRRAKLAGYPLYVLSNAGQDYYEYRSGIPALSYFDGVYISSDWKLLKPEREIYLSFLAQFSLNAEDCLFIDDVQANIDGAKAVGMDGICFNASREPIERLYGALAEKGVVI